jgi:hypothetical protein
VPDRANWTVIKSDPLEIIVTDDAKGDHSADRIADQVRLLQPDVDRRGELASL